MPKLQLGRAVVFEAPASPVRMTYPQTPPPCEAELRSQVRYQAELGNERGERGFAAAWCPADAQSL
ncbi:MAG TPA: hypothetical protein VK961_15555 [Chthoniobacter sp.]|nr:hypothetical protein [Chthoniobacter sp.]